MNIQFFSWNQFHKNFLKFLKSELVKMYFFLPFCCTKLSIKWNRLSVDCLSPSISSAMALKILNNSMFCLVLDNVWNSSNPLAGGILALTFSVILNSFLTICMSWDTNVGDSSPVYKKRKRNYFDYIIISNYKYDVSRNIKTFRYPSLPLQFLQFLKAVMSRIT